MQKLDLGPTDILVINYPGDFSKQQINLMVADLLTRLKLTGIEIPVERILPLPAGVTLSSVSGPLSESKLKPHVDALTTDVRATVMNGEEMATVKAADLDALTTAALGTNESDGAANMVDAYADELFGIPNRLREFMARRRTANNLRRAAIALHHGYVPPQSARVSTSKE